MEDNRCYIKKKSGPEKGYGEFVRRQFSNKTGQDRPTEATTVDQCLKGQSKPSRFLEKIFQKEKKVEKGPKSRVCMPGIFQNSKEAGVALADRARKMVVGSEK